MFGARLRFGGLNAFAANLGTAGHTHGNRPFGIVGKSEFASGNSFFRRNFPNIEEEFS